MIERNKIKEDGIKDKVVSMWKGLKEELSTARKNRGVSSKVIILECECTPAYFYKVVSGKRRPGKELIKKLAKSLEVSENYIGELLSAKEVSSNTGEQTYYNSKYFIVLTVCIVSIVAGYFFIKYLLSHSESDLPSAPVKITPRVLGDSSAFIKDVTIPDGSYILTNKKFKKIWRIKNTGSVRWKGRYLMRITPFESLTCHSDFIVPIKLTLPGNEVDIEVNFTSMQLSGSCRTDWKMVDRFKKPFFLNKQGLYSIVYITNDKSLIPTKGH